MAVRNMTDEEKAKMVENLTIDTSELNISPKDSFIQGLNDYVDNISKQVLKLCNEIIPTNLSIVKYLEELEKSKPYDTIKDEIKARRKMIDDATISVELMRGRLDVCKEVLDFCEKNYDGLVKFDFFTGNKLGLEDAKSMAYSYINRKEDANN